MGLCDFTLQLSTLPPPKLSCFVYRLQVRVRPLRPEDYCYYSYYSYVVQHLFSITTGQIPRNSQSPWRKAVAAVIQRFMRGRYWSIQHHRSNSTTCQARYGKMEAWNWHGWH